MTDSRLIKKNVHYSLPFWHYEFRLKSDIWSRGMRNESSGQYLWPYGDVISGITGGQAGKPCVSTKNDLKNPGGLGFHAKSCSHKRRYVCEVKSEQLLSIILNAFLADRPLMLVSYPTLPTLTLIHRGRALCDFWLSTVFGQLPRSLD